MFQVTKSTSHSLNIPGLQHALGVLSNKGEQRLYYVVPDTVFFKVRTVPKEPAGALLPATVQIWILEVDLRSSFQKNLTDVRRKRVRIYFDSKWSSLGMYAHRLLCWPLVFALQLQDEKRTEIALRLELAGESASFAAAMIGVLRQPRTLDAFLAYPTGFRAADTKPPGSEELGWVEGGQLYLDIHVVLVWVRRASSSSAAKKHKRDSGSSSGSGSKGSDERDDQAAASGAEGAKPMES